MATKSGVDQEKALGKYRKLLPHLSQGVPLARIAESENLSVSTLQRWLRGYKKLGLSALSPKVRSDKGERRKFEPELQSLIEGLWLRKPAPTIAFVHRTVKEICAREDWACPSYSSVYDIIKKIDGGLVMLAQEGTKTYKQTFDLIFRREAKKANEIWQADHTQLDCFAIDNNGKSKKPWLTIVIDDFSRGVAGYFLSFEAPSAIRTALALRQAIGRKTDARWHIYGIPEQFYTDHGSDFTSAHMEQVAADLKFELVFSTVGEPRGRGKIERFFRTVNQLFLPLMPGHAPKGARAVTGSLTLDQLDRAFREWLLSDYLLRTHSETGKPPQTFWESSGFIPRAVDSPEQLDLLLLTVARPRKVHQDGIHFHGFRYMNINLAGFVGESVVIRYDPRDLAEIMVYVNNKFLCRAICAELADETVSLKSLIHARNEKRKQLRNSLKDRTAVVNRYRIPYMQPPLMVADTNTSKSDIKKLKKYESE